MGCLATAPQKGVGGPTGAGKWRQFASLALPARHSPDIFPVCVRADARAEDPLSEHAPELDANLRERTDPVAVFVQRGVGGMGVPLVVMSGSFVSYPSVDAADRSPRS